MKTIVIFLFLAVAGFIGYKGYQMTKTKPSTPNTGGSGSGSGGSVPSEGFPKNDVPEEIKAE